MFLKEIGIVAKILPFSPRIGGLPFTAHDIKIEEIVDEKPFSTKIKASSFVIANSDVVDSDFNTAASKNSKKLGYNSLNGFFNQIRKAIKSSNRRKYIHAYWPEFDSLSHEYGVGSKKTEKHFKELMQKLERFVESIQNTNTMIIITSDHGFIDTPKDRIIMLEDHPQLKECLTLPLCGEGRTVYCYVHPSKAKDFEKYVKTRLNKFCYMYKSQDLINKNYFGLFKPNQKLFDRIGDYILILKENYVLKDRILNLKRNLHIGNHGGISKQEIIVPLVVVKA